MATDASPRAVEAAVGPSKTGVAFDIGALELVHKFVEHLGAEQASDAEPDGTSARRAVDWEAVAGAVGGSPCLEIAIGRAIVVAARLIRDPSSSLEALEESSSSTTEDPFFAFSLADVVPDFGDDRYRSRVARRIAGMIGMRPTSAVHD